MTELLAQSMSATRVFGHLAVVRDVDLQVAPREVVGLLGANGAGKTTLIRMLLGLLPPTQGEVSLFGQPPSIDTRRRLGYVPQGLGLYEDLTPAENMAFAHAAFGGDALAGLPAGLEPLRKVPVGRLPLGVQRRLAFAQALAHRPDLLVLDEPTSGVDPLASARLWETIRDAADADAGVLVTTHHMDEAAECDRLIVMADGRVVAEGKVATIVGFARVTVVETPDWAGAFETIERAGKVAGLVGRTLRVPGTTPEQVLELLAPMPAKAYSMPATLEERFLELTQPAARAVRAP
ncbi:MAG TPA: ABC transporter ATP-binding protein [Streptosporangiaceae bacterium]|nr:ABC transporter ATP-binding protein [Streptosporangiaceae bacterium]